jgi:hypothetical protein
MYNELKIVRLKTMDLGDALRSLYDNVANCKWRLEGMEYVGLQWDADNAQPKPTEAALIAEVARLQQEYDDTVYQLRRKVEYPAVEDFLDAIVKGDEEQKQAYIDACLAVKAKYPKPSGV